MVTSSIWLQTLTTELMCACWQCTNPRTNRNNQEQAKYHEWPRHWMKAVYQMMLILVQPITRQYKLNTMKIRRPNVESVHRVHFLLLVCETTDRRHRPMWLARANSSFCAGTRDSERVDTSRMRRRKRFENPSYWQSNIGVIKLN